MASQPVLRVAPWLLLMVCAYTLGRWQGAQAPVEPPSDVGKSEDASVSVAPSEGEGIPPPPAPETAPPPEAPPSRAEVLAAELDGLAEAARSIPVPDARTYAFFEKLTVDDLGPVAARIERMAPGNEQDVLFIMAVRRWGQLDGAAAVERASTFPALGTRTNARLAAFESWGAADADAAFAAALEVENEEGRARALGAVLNGAATSDPAHAVELLQTAPPSFLDSDGATAAANQIAGGAFGTGKGGQLREVIAGMPDGPLRAQMIETLASEWGSHYPEEALQWAQEAAPEGEAREAAINGIFLSLVQKDPALAATWGADFPDENRRTSYIAAAVQAWARFDVIAAETWVNEQPSGRYLDGAGYAMAAHFMARRDMPRSFSWIRRINTLEMRAELMGTLGRMWASERPDEFKNFLETTSLNRAEVEMLLAKIPPAS